MRVFNAFFRIIWKYKFSVILFTAIFLGLSIVFGAMAGDSTEQVYKETKVSIAVFDHDQTEASKAVYDYLGKVHSIETVEDTFDAKMEAFFNAKIIGIIEIEPGFEEGLLNGDLEGKLTAYNNPIGSGNIFVSMQAQEYVSTLNSFLSLGYDMEEAIEKTEENLGLASEIGFVSEDAGKEYLPHYYYFMYLTYALVSICIYALSPVFIRFRQKDLKDRMNCAAFSEKKRSLVLAAGALVFGLGLLLLFLVIGIGLYSNMDGFWEEIKFYAANALVHLLFAISIPLLLSTLIQKINVISVFANIIGLGLSFISGVFVPQELLSEGVLKVAKCFPTYWYVDIVNKIQEMGANLAWADISMGLSIQFLYALALFALSLVAVKVKKA